ncbi:hypothetical protein EDC04DRAFT_2689659 [Pisolithus marmoratus]|nr:hypothetical protein EDC04DRAFT_2689659 [Pisolithus marmoratus]
MKHTSVCLSSQCILFVAASATSSSSLLKVIPVCFIRRAMLRTEIVPEPSSFLVPVPYQKNQGNHSEYSTGILRVALYRLEFDCCVVQGQKVIAWTPC